MLAPVVELIRYQRLICNKHTVIGRFEFYLPRDSVAESLECPLLAFLPPVNQTYNNY